MRRLGRQRLETEYVKWRSGRGHAGTWKMREKQRQVLQPARKQQGWWIAACTMQEMTLGDQGLIVSLLLGIHLRAQRSPRVRRVL